MLSIELMAAERGDGILIEYGPGAEPTNRVLIDGGPVNSGQYQEVRERLLAVPQGRDGRRHFDLLVVSHVDSDHIEGVIRLLQDPELRCVFDDVWFNGWKHIEPINPGATVSMLGPTQGEFLGALLTKQGRPWNQFFRGGAIFVPDGDEPLPCTLLRGGLEVTIVSPDIKRLERLAARWDVAVRDAGFEPGDAAAALEQLEGEWWARGPVVLGDDDELEAASDTSPANGSSIAFLAAYNGRRLLLTGDAYDDVLTASLRRWKREHHTSDPVRLDAFKLSHHGSENNTTPQVMEQVACDHYLVSTNGKRFQHPDALAIRTVIDRHQGERNPVLCFNYETPQTELWRQGADHEARYGAQAKLTFD